MTLIYLDRKRTIENEVGFSLYDLITTCGYKINRTKTGAINGFKKAIQFLTDNKIITFNKNIKELKGNNYVSVKFTYNLDLVENFTIMTFDEIDTLLQSTSKIEKANLFAVYLYMKSFMFQRNLNDEGMEFKDAKDKPMAFWKYIKVIQEDLCLSKETVNKCLKEYIKLKLFIKYETGNYTIIKSGKQSIRKAPNIYVLNDNNAKQEIKWALNKLKEILNTNEFQYI